MSLNLFFQFFFNFFSFFTINSQLPNLKALKEKTGAFDRVVKMFSFLPPRGWYCIEMTQTEKKKLRSKCKVVLQPESSFFLFSCLIVLSCSRSCSVLPSAIYRFYV